MASNTPNLKLLKKDPLMDGDDTFNIKTMLNDNWDKIDEAVGDIEESIENINVPVTSVNGETGDVKLTAKDVGAETPSGAQEKANAALSTAKDYTDQEVAETKGIIGTISGLLTTAKSNLVAAINEIFNDLKTHKADNANPHKVSQTQVGLGNIQNYAIATQAEAEAGTTNVKYVTPLRVKEAILKLTPTKSAEGTYTGTGVNDRVINIGFTPKIVFITNNESFFIIYDDIDSSKPSLNLYNGVQPRIANFGYFVTNGFAVNTSASSWTGPNSSSKTHKWVAFS